uniref:Uncharacterized protein n=1 Tax=Romanomermis culicivorax TaxID=13658 RepID=A0A915KEK5_ROMCU
MVGQTKDSLSPYDERRARLNCAYEIVLHGGGLRQRKYCLKNKLIDLLEYVDDVVDEDWKEYHVNGPLTRNRKDPSQTYDDSH